MVLNQRESPPANGWANTLLTMLVHVYFFVTLRNDRHEDRWLLFVVGHNFHHAIKTTERRRVSRNDDSMAAGPCLCPPSQSLPRRFLGLRES